MIILNGLKFAENDKEFTNSLFEKDGTCAGYAKRRKRSILLSDHQHTPFGVMNHDHVLGSARKLENGKIWYSYGTPDCFSKMSMSAQREMIDNAAISRDHKGLIFK